MSQPNCRYDKDGFKIGFWIEEKKENLFEGGDSILYIQTGYYIKNKREGLWSYKIKDSADKLIKEIYFRNGIDDTLNINYFLNGNIKSKSIFSDYYNFKKYYDYKSNGNIDDSIIIQRKGVKEYNSKYNSHGVLITYCEKDDKDTCVIVINYRENGVLKSKLTQCNGSLFGFQEYFNEEGHIKTSFYLSNGQKNGEYKAYYNNGNLKELNNMKNSLKNGESIQYDENGKVLFRVIYDNDKPIKYLSN